MRVARTVLVVAAVAALAACSSGGDAGGAATGTVTSAADLAGSWTLVSGSTADGEIALVAEAPVTLEVGEDGSVHGTSACNQYMGEVTVADGTLSFGPLASTMMACVPDVAAVETAYLGALDAVDTAARDGDALVLTGGGAELTFGAAG